MKDSNEYLAIAAYYGDRVADRSRARLMDHIDQGLVILDAIDAPLDAKLAYCLHPLFQMDDALLKEGMEFISNHGWSRSTLLAMEYRGIANAYLSQHSMPPKGIKLSPFTEVNQLLIADKVQNRKDFERYHLGTHPKSDRLVEYFNEWLHALGISERRYQELVSMLEDPYCTP